MSKFNSATQVRPVVSTTGGGFISSASQTADTTTHEGGSGYTRTDKSELFLFAVSDFFSEGSFYEDKTSRNDRVVSLARKVAVEDLDWTTRFVRWLRTEANMRTVSLVIALEGAKGLIDAHIPGGRGLVSAAILRADEPGEALAYWTSRYGKNIPKSVKRGIADAAASVYTERSLSKYDTATKGFRFADVIQLTHVVPATPVKASLYKYALDRRYNSGASVPADLRLLVARQQFLANSGTQIRSWARDGSLSARIAEAGLTWEVLSSVISGGMDAEAWEAVIPSMGYMALLRNLRNFLNAGVSDHTLRSVAQRIADPEEVARSRQLPMRFLSAYRATQNSLVFATALDQALNASLKNVPVLKGRSLILVDRSGSMSWTTSKNSDLNFADTASIFGSALALRAESADLVQFGTNHRVVIFSKGDSILPLLKKFSDLGGTNTAKAVRANFNNHDRVIIITDEQVWGGWAGSDPTDEVPSKVPVYTWNLAGYKAGHGPTNYKRITIGGLSDASFATIGLIESGLNANWPF